MLSFQQIQQSRYRDGILQITGDIHEQGQLRTGHVFQQHQQRFGISDYFPQQQSLYVFPVQLQTLCFVQQIDQQRDGHVGSGLFQNPKNLLLNCRRKLFQVGHEYLCLDDVPGFQVVFQFLQKVFGINGHDGSPPAGHGDT